MRCGSGLARSSGPRLRLIEFLTRTFHFTDVNEDKGRGFLIITFHETRYTQPGDTPRAFLARGSTIAILQESLPRAGERNAPRNGAFVNSRS